MQLIRGILSFIVVVTALFMFASVVSAQCYYSCGGFSNNTPSSYYGYGVSPSYGYSPINYSSFSPSYGYGYGNSNLIYQAPQFNSYYGGGYGGGYYSGYGNGYGGGYSYGNGGYFGAQVLFY